MVNSSNANIPSERISVGQRCAFRSGGYISSAARAESRGIPPAGRCPGTSGLPMTRISDSEKRSFSARHGASGGAGGNVSANKIGRWNAIGGCSGQRRSRPLFLARAIHTSSPRGLSEMQKRQRQDPRMIFRSALRAREPHENPFPPLPFVPFAPNRIERFHG